MNKSITPLPRLSQIAVEGYKSISKRLTMDLADMNVLAGVNSSGKSSFIQPLLLLKQTWEANFDAGPLLIDGSHVKFSKFEQLLSGAANTQSKEFAICATFPKGGDVELRFSRDSQNRIQRRITKGSEGHLKTLNSVVHHLIHVPGLRGQPYRRYQAATVGERFLGHFDHYVAAVIAQWQETKDQRLEQLGGQLAMLGLTQLIQAHRVDDVSIELNVGRLPAPHPSQASDVVSIADVGFGVSQVLPVLVALLVARPGQFVYVEQPELHLHPKAQRALAHVFVNTLKTGAQVVVETHSALFLREIQTLVARGDKSLIKLHWVTRDEKGDTDLQTCDLDEAGAYGDWPQDFDETESQSATDYYEAAEAVLFRNAL